MICHIQTFFLYLLLYFLQTLCCLLIILLHLFQLGLIAILNLVFENSLCDGLKSVKRIFLLFRHIVQFLLQSGYLIIIFSQIIQSFIFVFSDTGSDFSDFFLIFQNLILNLSAFPQRFHVRHLCPVADKDVSTSCHQNINDINSCQIKGFLLWQQPIYAPWHSQKDHKNPQKKHQILF